MWPTHSQRNSKGAWKSLCWNDELEVRPGSRTSFILSQSYSHYHFGGQRDNRTWTNIRGQKKKKKVKKINQVNDEMQETLNFTSAFKLAGKFPQLEENR